MGQQPTLVNIPPSARIVNVASVPQRSPFRYPGGKTWLIPHIRRWLAHVPQRPRLFVEPFAGGGSVSLAVAAEGLAAHVLMVEQDARVAAVWRTILSGGSDALAEDIVTFALTPGTARAVLAQPPATVRDLAFQTLLRNRIAYGGILTRGGGMLKAGEHGKGLASRWYPQTLAQRIGAIAAMWRRLTFLEGDGLDVMRQYAERAGAVFFLDPPYTVAGKRAGKRLYTHAELDHAALFEVARAVVGDMVMTYDDAEEVRALAVQYGFETHRVAMKTTHHTVRTELLIGRDLTWARGA
jgi:DNA adenine methylase